MWIPFIVTRFPIDVLIGKDKTRKTQGQPIIFKKVKPLFFRSLRQASLKSFFAIF
jgi:hypothetical protein